MKPWDLNGSSAQLESVLDLLNQTRGDVQQYWNDAVACRYQEKHLDGIEPLIHRTVDAIRRMDDLFARARRALSDRDEIQ